MDGVKMDIDAEALEYIVDKAMEYKLGARGLRSIVEGILRDVLYEIPSSGKQHFRLTAKYAREHFDINLSLQMTGAA